MPNDSEKEKLRQPSIWRLGKTEAENLQINDSFFLERTPNWFAFVSWLFVLGGLQYFVDKTHHWFIILLFISSYGFLYFYLNAFLYNFPFYRLLPDKYVKSDRFAHVFSVSVAGIILITILLSMRTVIEMFSLK